MPPSCSRNPRPVTEHFARDAVERGLAQVRVAIVKYLLVEATGMFHRGHNCIFPFKAYFQDVSDVQQTVKVWKFDEAGHGGAV